MRWYLIALILLPLANISSQNGYELTFDIQGFDGDTLYLGNHFGDKKYLADTTTRSENGTYVFRGSDSLPGGMYLIVYPNKDKYFQFMLDTGDQRFRIDVTMDREVTTAKIEGSGENELFFEYLHFLRTHRPKADTLRKQIRNAGSSDKSKVKKWERELESINSEVESYQQKMLNEHPESMTASMIRVNQKIEIPDFEGDKRTVQRKKFNYFRKHYFDNIDMQDPRLIRTPMLYNRVNHFIENMTVQRPDSISKSLDFVLNKLEGNEEAYRFVLSHYLNKYIRSEIVGMDAIYVHLVKNYYDEGKAPWVDSAQLSKMRENVERLQPILVGKTAPDITLQDRDGKRYSLHGIDSAFTVLLFWSPECGHCKEVMPDMIDFYKNYKDRNIEVFAVCTKVQDETKQCWEFIDEHEGMEQWLNLVDPWLRSNFNQLYDIRSTPKVFVLDKDQRIVTKKIGVKQLPEVMDKIFELKEQGRLSEFY